MCCNLQQKPFLHDILVNFDKTKSTSKERKKSFALWVMGSRASQGLNDSQSHYILAS